MNLSDKIESSPEQNFEYDASGVPWPESYYMEKNPAMRLSLLNETLKSSPSEDDLIRKKLFDMRYEPNKYGEGGYADLFMRSFMNFCDFSKNRPSRIGISFARKKVIKELNSIGLGKDNDWLNKDILLDEFCHVGRLYIALSADSKQYRSVFLGFGKLNDNALISKLHRDLAAAGIEVANTFGLHEEMKLWIQGLENARALMLPDSEPFI